MIYLYQIIKGEKMIKLNEGDTLAIKIENYNKEFDGKYFLFIKSKNYLEPK